MCRERECWKTIRFEKKLFWVNIEYALATTNGRGMSSGQLESESFDPEREPLERKVKWEARHLNRRRMTQECPKSHFHSWNRCTRCDFAKRREKKELSSGEKEIMLIWYKDGERVVHEAHGTRAGNKQLNVTTCVFSRSTAPLMLMY